MHAKMEGMTVRVLSSSARRVVQKLLLAVLGLLVVPIAVTSAPAAPIPGREAGGIADVFAELSGIKVPSS